MRIGVIGCAGTGKSILAQKLAQELDIPFLASKEITSEILTRDGYDYASGQQVEKFLATKEHQQEILERTKEQQSAKDFVTDRTAIDLAAYAILEMEGPLNVKLYIKECKKLLRRYDYLFFCPWQNRRIKDNHRRTLDPWYQFAVHSVELEVIELFKVGPVMLMNRSKVDDRVEGILAWIKATTAGKDTGKLLETM